ncbi:acyltransferase family protein [Demequina zhanjiangensis]|uniref:Acyltransferase family protein n=1 Tax=Demequina zhanjiangensis TaxID=3051659 RepID=A0ABT8FXL0_9MICO|nr:acyltransferase family protein [Demequina sp. SYSU T00b26]MDN4471641.1 acyltransferase family protein [Demequina sp. SYSU T00b26]
MRARLADFAGADPIVENGSTPARASRRDIQALRAFAVLAVIGYHYWPELLPGGFIGVDVFFVISGYLVGGALMREASRTGRVDMRGFMLRRARRILPAAMVVIAVTVVGASLLSSPVRSALWKVPWSEGSYSREALAAVAQVSNLLFAGRHVDYDSAVPSPFLHFWSLGVETQFYLLMPLVAVGVAAAVARASNRSELVEPLVLAALSIGLIDLMLVVGGTDGGFYNPLGRLAEFVAGVVVARVAWRYRTRASTAVVALGWSLLFATSFLVALSQHWPSFVTLLPVVGAMAVLLPGSALRVAGLGRSSLVQGCGDRSYSLYLVHWPLLVLAGILLDREPSNLERIVILAIVAVLAEALYRYVEQPARRLPIESVNDRRRAVLRIAFPTVVAFSSALAIGIASSLSPTVGSQVAERYAPIDLAELPGQVATSVPVNVRPAPEVASVDLPAFSPPHCHETSGQDERTGPCIVGDEGAPLVVLWGDSHAAQWYPALALMADQGTIRLESYTKGGCSPLAGITADDSLSGRCLEWLEWSLAQIVSSEPAAIVSTSKLSYHWDDSEVSPEAYVDGLDWLGRRLPAGVPVVWISDNPRFPESPGECAVRHIHEVEPCNVPRLEAFPHEVQADVNHAARERGFGVLDMTDLFCTESSCPIILGDILVYRDDDHVTATFAEASAPVVEPAVLAALEAQRG